MGKKCGICNSVNSSESIYCKNCGHFLYAAASGDGVYERTARSIWEINPETGESRSNSQSGTAVNARIRPGMAGRTVKPVPKAPAYMICPACASREPFVNGQKPLFCSVCNYIFQESDKPAEPARAGKEATASTPEVKGAIKRHGPMRQAKEDHSFLRFIGIDVSRTFTLEVRQEEGILGSSGTLRPELFRSGFFHAVKPQQLKVSHSPAGWYLQALDGSNVLNGGALQRGMSRRLADGDFVNMGDCVLRVEIMGIPKAGQNPVNCQHPLSSLRFIGNSKNGSFVLDAKPEGNIVRCGQHLQLWYSSDHEWHIRALSPMTLLNGEELNIGFCQRVSDGDLINMGENILRVEIVRNGNG